MMAETQQVDLGAFGADPPAKRVRDLQSEAERVLRVHGRPRLEVPDDA